MSFDTDADNDNAMLSAANEIRLRVRQIIGYDVADDKKSESENAKVKMKVMAASRSSARSSNASQEERMTALTPQARKI